MTALLPKGLAADVFLAMDNDVPAPLGDQHRRSSQPRVRFARIRAKLALIDFRERQSLCGGQHS
jgi:hypothetical protein